MNTVDQRKAEINKTLKHINGRPYSWNEISLAIEGSFTNLRIWIGNEKSISEGCGRKMVYMRIDKKSAYSVPLSRKSAGYLTNQNNEINELLEFYQFGETSIEDLDKILEITKNMKSRIVEKW